ncbi:5,10-methylene-tetrahydrofolate dehydrogenase/methenyl tetrahydrofolate cyclohydrolase [Saccharothrix tamanrassetensis]|uniref:5,10-methylene-tetrahydrofolate dehydrogenase/methenyl tetrahydrofolate cyclohydrolase n=1 Tax=Saccharothrix tamanrassetensis TaxID=1051531 RepID=A0A841CF87_9PSEU|nr:tetrahydrofolate dehydrogenase/cyclohydrolase catalytic domain-containing protein [Saccharothrix tamanrassetensis]MBB5955999.1 5,10-methylene-tetrahydrofolate dehydrogenase/methenyl tetrahydrofolate cyclohydrolase [Saccharothrix tamanrassetensis]
MQDSTPQQDQGAPQRPGDGDGLPPVALHHVDQSEYGVSTVVTRDVEGWRRDENALYRGDTRSPEEIRAAGGFHPHQPDAPDLRRHVHGDTNAFVSTSTEQKVGVERAGRGAVYVIRAPGGIHTDPTMRANGDNRGYNEAEVLFPGGVDWRYVAGWHEVRYDPGEGRLVPGDFVPNPDYIGDKPVGRPDRGSADDSSKASEGMQEGTQPSRTEPGGTQPSRTVPGPAEHGGTPFDRPLPPPARTDHTPPSHTPPSHTPPTQAPPSHAQPGRGQPGDSRYGRPGYPQQHPGQVPQGPPPGFRQHNPYAGPPNVQPHLGQAHPSQAFPGSPYHGQAANPAQHHPPAAYGSTPHGSTPYGSTPYADTLHPQHHDTPSFGPSGSQAWEARQRAEAEATPPTTETPKPTPTYERVERPQRPLSQRLGELSDERLDRLRPLVRATPAGMSVFGHGDRNQQYTANVVPKVPGQFVVDMHGSANSVRVDKSNLGPDDVADILMANPDWDGRTPILLVGCQTGKLPDGFAARLAERTGVPVTAPTTDAWVDYDGNVFASSGHSTVDGARPGWPPNGEWHTYGPDGAHRVDESPYPPGREPTWGDDTPAEAPSHAAQRGDDGSHPDSTDGTDPDGTDTTQPAGEVRTELRVDEPNRISGRSILKDVREAYVESYRSVIEPQQKQVAVIRFDSAPDDADSWKAKMDASRVSADQKVKNISALGYHVDNLLLPPATSQAEFRQLLERFGDDPSVSGIIVQMPAPVAFGEDVRALLPPDKDIDALLGEDSPQAACATADGISKVVEPFLAGGPTVAVVGYRGFVGAGVLRMLEQHGVDPVRLDFGDDLTRVRDADVVISVTGSPGILGPEHLRPDHLLVVDSGFVPQPDGSIASDVRGGAAGIPRHITPVPGGIGPVEMAVLLERLVRMDVNPDLPPWRVVRPEGT